VFLKFTTFGLFWNCFNEPRHRHLPHQRLPFLYLVCQLKLVLPCRCFDNKEQTMGKWNLCIYVFVGRFPCILVVPICPNEQGVLHCCSQIQEFHLKAVDPRGLDRISNKLTFVTNGLRNEIRIPLYFRIRHQTLQPTKNSFFREDAVIVYFIRRSLNDNATRMFQHRYCWLKWSFWNRFSQKQNNNEVRLIIKVSNNARNCFHFAAMTFDLFGIHTVCTISGVEQDSVVPWCSQLGFLKPFVF